jgi:hypothetical protein
MKASPSDFLGRLAGPRFAAILSPCLLAALSLVVAGQVSEEPRLIPSKDRTFRIPFQTTQPNDRRLREVQLFVSTDQGRTWRLGANAAPETGTFQPYTAPQDGLYFFAVRTIDLQGRAYPASDAEFRAGLKVLVDTVPPSVYLEALPPREGSVGVKWDVRDDNLEPATIRLEYAAPGTNQWTPVRIDPIARGEGYWSPMTNGPFEVRMTASDTVGNVGRHSVMVGPGAAGLAPNAGAAPQPAGQTPLRIVNSTTISLNYKIDDVGPSGVSAVELWYTQDGRSWQKHSEQKRDERKPDETTPKPPYVVEVSGEGVYGFTLVVRSGVGLGDRPPQLGDPPQIWVEVDKTRPVVHLLNVEVGQGAATGSLTVAWTATDKNLGPQPITLSYATQTDGPWTPITQGPIDNNGRYVWRMPPGVPYQFHVKVEATDKAGNVGSAQTTQLVKVDLAKPRPTIIDVNPGAK